jgi:hypothetical protein
LFTALSVSLPHSFLVSGLRAGLEADLVAEVAVLRAAAVFVLDAVFLAGAFFAAGFFAADVLVGTVFSLDLCFE